MPSAIELFGVTKSFGQKVAVDALDLTVPEGSIYGFIGPNGSGKTTTLRLILRIYQPDAGRVVVLGSDQGNVADDRLGYLPEERGLYKRMKVLDLIEYFAHLKGCYDCRDAAKRWLERLDAGSWAGQRLDSLSKGMAQKVQFIVAVIARPKLLILDEPFAGLDPVNLESLQNAVTNLRHDGTTVVLSTHDMNVAARLCDTILMIHQGRKVLDGSIDDIQRRYPVSSVRLRLGGGAELPADLPDMAAVERQGAFYVLTLEGGATPQRLLRHVAASRDVEHFEVMRPTLHDIFVDIARPHQAAEGVDGHDGQPAASFGGGSSIAGDGTASFVRA
jgi:ABC-2 type transport system ATP-binding protein